MKSTASTCPFRLDTDCRAAGTESGVERRPSSPLFWLAAMLSLRSHSGFCESCPSGLAAIVTTVKASLICCDLTKRVRESRYLEIAILSLRQPRKIVPRHSCSQISF